MSDSAPPRYPDVTGTPDFPAIEEAILAYWKRERIFEASVEERDAGENGANEFVFYDGPPFANGLPHYGHLLTGVIKDVFPRYQTMKGRRSERRFGWDCHGLPAEMAAEKEIGVSGRQAIQEYGIEKFNAHCRESVLRYASEWQRVVTRGARWVDFENDYKTMDLSYMESVIWAFKSLWDKGLIYEGHRVMPYSWACETPLSNFETKLDNSYRPRQDPALTVGLELETPLDGDVRTRLLVWTTTPWTLPSNLAVAVGPEIDYAIVEHGDVRFVLGEATLEKYAPELGEATRVGTVRGADLIGLRYRPLFPFFADHADSFVVLGADFVDTTEGTGLVHMAPGFGEEDQRVCEEAGIELVCPVDESGRFTAPVTDYEGQNVLEANKPIIRDLKDRGAVLRHETYEHDYPHCWRTDTPLIYRAISSWYVRVTDFRDRMLELNQQINWVPSHVKDGQFGRWLEGARDWSISRNRFWGAPLPVWQSDDPQHPRTDVYGSLDELEADFGVRPTDLHRPTIDELTRPNPDDPTGQSTMRRVPEVLDCWFESGSMTFAQVHYPFENKEWFEDHFPADFITEYIAQTRGWFYTMMVLGTALFDRPPFRNCVCHGIVLDEDGLKLSKRKDNYPKPDVVLSKYGADALRWFLIASPVVRGGNLKIDPKGKGFAEVVRLVINPLWNAYAFFTRYANSDDVRASFRTDATGVLDRYILAKTRDLVTAVGEAMDAYDLGAACDGVLGFIDVLNNWYIRRSRPRFWKSEKDADKQDAYDTLSTVLGTLCRVAAPLLPLLTEELHRGLTNERSVHLTYWPVADAFPRDADLVRDMDMVRAVCSNGLALRESHRLRIRLPLPSLTVVAREAERLEPYAELIRDELNVKEVRFATEVEAFATHRTQVNARVVGPRLGGTMKSVLAAVRSGDATLRDDGRLEAAGQVLEPHEFERRLQPKEGLVCQAIGVSDALVSLDVTVTPELEREGLARDLVRQIQQARKDADLHMSDRIVLTLDVEERLGDAARAHESYIGEQTLASDVRYASVPGAAATSIDGETVRIGVAKAG